MQLNASQVQHGTLRTAVNQPCACCVRRWRDTKGRLDSDFIVQPDVVACITLLLKSVRSPNTTPRLLRPGRGALLWRRRRQEGRKPHAAALICNALSTATPSTQQCARRSRQQAWRRAVGGGAGRGGAAAQSDSHGSQSQRARWRQGARAMRAISLGGAGFRPSPALSSFSGPSSVLL